MGLWGLLKKNFCHYLGQRIKYSIQFYFMLHKAAAACTSALNNESIGEVHSIIASSLY